MGRFRVVLGAGGDFLENFGEGLKEVSGGFLGKGLWDFGGDFVEEFWVVLSVWGDECLEYVSGRAENRQ